MGVSHISLDLKIHSVSACCKNFGIGFKGDLPWHLPKELKHFSKITTGNPPSGKQNVVIMGRKTWESLPEKFKPLKNRYNFVLSRSKEYVDPRYHAAASSLEELVELLASDLWKNKIHDVFNVGGRQIYQLIQDSPFCGKIYLTKIFADYECDTFFPSLDNFELEDPNILIDGQEEVEEKNGVKWKVEVYRKKS